MENADNEFNISKDQLQSFSNNVFAVAITLLVLNFTVPALQDSNRVLVNFLMSLWPQFLGYTISFFIIAAFFLNLHGYLKKLKYVNIRIFWTTMLQFFFIVLIPFSTLVMTEYGQLQIANVFFDINILIIGLLFFLNKYLWTDGLINDNNSLEDYDKWKDLLIPICAAIAILISFISPHHSQYAFLILFLPLIFRLKG